MPFGWWLQVILLICRLTVVQFLHLFCREELNQAAGDDSNSLCNPVFFSASRFKRLCLWMVQRFPRSLISSSAQIKKQNKKNHTSLNSPYLLPPLASILVPSVQWRVPVVSKPSVGPSCLFSPQIKSMSFAVFYFVRVPLFSTFISSPPFSSFLLPPHLPSHRPALPLTDSAINWFSAQCVPSVSL